MAAMIALCATTIAGCSSSGFSAPETVTVTEAAGQETEVLVDEKSADATEVVQPATAAPATFDRNDPNFEFFNICEELTNEDLAEFGLEGTFDQSNIEDDNYMSSCGLRELNPSDWIESTVMAMAGISMDELKQRTRPVSSSGNSSLPGTWTFVAKQETSDLECNAAVPTAHGMLWISYGIFRDGVYTQQEVCDKALRYLETIHSIVEKKV